MSSRDVINPEIPSTKFCLIDGCDLYVPNVFEVIGGVVELVMGFQNSCGASSKMAHRPQCTPSVHCWMQSKSSMNAKWKFQELLHFRTCSIHRPISLHGLNNKYR